jgi:hypothetical protein
VQVPVLDRGRLVIDLLEPLLPEPAQVGFDLLGGRILLGLGQRPDGRLVGGLQVAGQSVVLGRDGRRHPQGQVPPVLEILLLGLVGLEQGPPVLGPPDFLLVGGELGPHPVLVHGQAVGVPPLGVGQGGADIGRVLSRNGRRCEKHERDR